MSFGEGGVASRSRLNPVCDYNKDKPQKLCVDFFVLCNNSPGKSFILHCDIYQGKNAKNIGIPKEITKLPATQKAAVKTIIQNKIGKDPNGIRQFFMDNRYACASLFVLLRENFDIICAGTTRTNRVGWQKDNMTTSKSAA